eukprot:11158569-Lingulodinium_polyedra.AAC.1
MSSRTGAAALPAARCPNSWQSRVLRCHCAGARRARNTLPRQKIRQDLLALRAAHLPLHQPAATK